MEGISRSNIDASSERLVITNLTNDLIDMYPHDDIAGNFCYQFMMMLQDVKGAECVKYDGEPYLFDPSRKDIFEGNGLPIFLNTPKRWTKMIMSVNRFIDYKKVTNYLFLVTHRYPGSHCTSPLEEDPEADSFIIQKFNRDLIYYNNMQKLIKK